MNLTKRNKLIIAGVALAGAAAVTGSAFTAGGLDDSSTDNFIGGTVRQTITGATITDVDYVIDADTNAIHTITVEFLTGDNVNGRTLRVSLKDSSGVQTGGGYTCPPISGTPSKTVCTAVLPKAISRNVQFVDFTVDDTP